MKEIKIDGNVYQIEIYNHEAEIYINDNSYIIEPGSDDMKVKVGTMNDLVVFFSLVEWDIKDSNGGKVIISPKFDNNGNVIVEHLRNYRRYLPLGIIEKLFVEASRHNRLSKDEKKNLLPPPVSG